MTISEYVKETEFASRKIIEAIWNDINRRNKLKEEIERESNFVQQEYDSALAMQFYAEDPDDIMAGVGRYWDNYFGSDKIVFHKNEKLVRLTGLLASRELSLNILSGNLLEHAKKGLSLVYGHFNNWPLGRLVGSQALSNVILQSRNQSIHIDEAISKGKYNNCNIKKCFKTLEIELDIVFAGYLKQDMAFEILKILNWTTFETYKKDIGTIV